ncbi:MAG: glycosyltransferase [Candidatus Omnitrophica bacterium]|nr:glycosyltransferase [Candidatus Omnitrophota bacterium]
MQADILAVNYQKWMGASVAVEEGIRTFYLSRFLQLGNITLSIGVWVFCLKELRKYSLVHLYGFYDLLIPAVAFFSRMYKVPYIVEPMGMFRPVAKGVFKKRFYHFVFTDFIVKHAGYFIVSSELEKTDLEVMGVPSHKIVLRRNGLDPDEFKDFPAIGTFRKSLSIPKDCPMILYFGRVVSKKGVDLLIEAFYEISNRAVLVIAGPDNENPGYFKSLKNLVLKANLQERIFFVGPKFGSEKMELYVDADIFALPSRHENFGNVAVEAVACHRPVLITNRCGVAPLIKPAAVIVDCDVESIKMGLIKLLDVEYRKSLQEKCGEVIKGLTWDEPIDQMLRLYKELTEHKSV